MSIADYAEDRLGATISGTSNELRCDCVECGKQNHLYVNADTGLAHCFSCGYSANLAGLIRDLEGISWPEAYKKSILLSGAALRHKARHIAGQKGSALEAIRDILLRGLEAVRQSGTAQAQQQLKLPLTACPIRAGICVGARNYLASRGFTPAIYKPYGLHFCNSLLLDSTNTETIKQARLLDGHIIFPEYAADGKLTYYTTRSIRKNAKPKSLHPENKEKSIYGISGGIAARGGKESEFCVLVEGPLDAVALGGYGVAALGKTLVDSQLAQLRTQYKKVIVCFDTGELVDTFYAARALKDAGISAYVSTLQSAHVEYKDTAQMLESGLTPHAILGTVLENAKPYTPVLEFTMRLLKKR